MDWSTTLFKFGTLLYIIEEVTLSILILVLYKFMLGIFFIRKDSINFLWFTLPIWYRVEKLSIEIAWSVLFLCLTIALFSLLVRKSDLCCCNLLAKLSLHQYTANYMNYKEWNKCLHLFLNLSFLYCASTFWSCYLYYTQVLH